MLSIVLISTLQLRKQDMTMEQLKQYNGLGPEGRVLVAVNGKIFDVTKGNTIHNSISSLNPFIKNHCLELTICHCHFN